MKSFRFLSASALAGVALSVPHAAYAQTVAPEVAEEAAGEAIVVTGSRIRRPNLESSIPITSIGGEEFLQQGQSNIGDTLNELPQLRSTFAQQNPGLGIGIAGLNLLDLRGLGTARTLVLVNGRRHVGADILNNAVSPDVNTIPNDLIERVDVVTGGNSAIYGSDAIAGVVNFILKRDFEGLQVRGNAAVAQQGFGGNQYLSALYGVKLDDGRGNIMLHGEFANQDRIFGSDIDSFRTNNALAVTDIDQAGLVNGSDGIPDRTFIRDIRSVTINRFGLVPVTQRSTGGTPLCGIGISNGLTGTANAPTAYNCTYVFTSVGQLTTQTGTRFGQGITGGITGGNGQTGREDKLLSVLPSLQRYSFNTLGHYEYSDALEAFFEAKVVRVDARGSNAGPSFIQGTQAQFDARERVRLDNPFLVLGDPTARTTLTNAILASGCNTSLTVACAPATAPTQGLLTPAQITAIGNGSYRFVVARSLLDSGIRDEEFRRDTFRIVGGIRGKFNDDWSYEISSNYGKMKETTTTYGYLDRQRFMLALDAGAATPGGTIQCRSQFDPASATAFTQGLSAAAAAANVGKLAADIAACRPYNPFGGSDNSAAAKFFVYNAVHRATLEQFDVQGFVAGDLSQLFELPGGPISFAIGGEFRQEKASYKQDPFVLTGATNAVVIPDFIPPTSEVKEAFGELRVPILKDMPFFHELTLSGAGRVAQYNNGIGTVYAYNGGAEWAPIRDIRFRANYGRSVRTPNVSETAFPRVPNFAPGFQDPCRPANIGAGSQFRAANCATDLGTLLPNLSSLGVYSLPIISGSNPTLKPEKSDSITIGVVVQPSFVPGFSVSVDYYNIRVNNVIVSLGAQAIADNCYDQPTLTNQFCALFTRYRGTGAGPFGENSGQILGNSLVSAGVNFAKRVRRGIDVDLSYRTDISENVKFDTRMIYTHNLTISNFQNPALPNFENRILEELGDPKDEFRFDANLTTGAVTFGYQMRYIGPMYVNLYEDFNALQDRPPQDADYADIQKYSAVFYHDVRVEWKLNNLGGVGRDFSFFAGVDNVLAKDPPLGVTGTGAGSSIYNVRGRNFYGGFKARF